MGASTRVCSPREWVFQDNILKYAASLMNKPTVSLQDLTSLRSSRSSAKPLRPLPARRRTRGLFRRGTRGPAQLPDTHPYDPTEGRGVSPNTLTDGGSKGPRACCKGFCHFCHLVTLGFSRSTRPHTQHRRESYLEAPRIGHGRRQGRPSQR